MLYLILYYYINFYSWLNIKKFFVIKYKVIYNKYKLIYNNKSFCCYLIFVIFFLFKFFKVSLVVFKVGNVLVNDFLVFVC